MSKREQHWAGSPPLRWRNCIRQQRERAGLTQTELAKRAGLHTSNLALIEMHRRQPNVATLIRLAVALDCTLDDLVELEDAGDFERFVSRCGDLRRVEQEESER